MNQLTALDQKTYDLRFKAPFTACLSAGTKCGKTVWAMEFVRRARTLIHPPPERIYWAYGEYQDQYTQLPPDVIMINGLPDMEVFKADKTVHKLLICDDLMRTFKKDQLAELFCQGSHHWNLSVLHIVQNLFFANLRNARINSHYIILMKNPADKLQLQTLARQAFPGKQKLVVEAFEDACAEPFGHLLIDLEPKTDDCMRLRTKVFDLISYVYILV